MASSRAPVAAHRRIVAPVSGMEPSAVGVEVETGMDETTGDGELAAGVGVDSAATQSLLPKSPAP